MPAPCTARASWSSVAAFSSGRASNRRRDAFPRGATAPPSVAMSARRLSSALFASLATSSRVVSAPSFAPTARASALRGFLAPSRPRAARAPSSAADASGAGAVIDATSDDPGAPFADIQGLHPLVVDALARLGFDRATGIQSRAVPAVQSGADVVVAAETGSGKTLSYLVPVFSNLLHHGARAGSTGRLGALILAPNATLVEQVTRVARSLVDDAGEPLLRVAALTPETSMPFNLPDVVVATPARAAEDVARFSEGAWRRGNFAPAVVHVRHVVFDEADMLLSGGYLKPVRGLFDVLYREEKLAALGLTAPPSDADDAESEPERGWDGDAGRGASAYDRDWRKDHADIPAKANISTSGPALGGKGRVGVGEGRDFRRQYVFAAATVMSAGKKTPGAMIKYGFPDATWVEGRRLHRSVASVQQTWIRIVDERERPDALGRALRLDARDESHASSERTMVFVNSTDACEAVTEELLRQGLRATAFHAEVSTVDRADRLRALAEGEAEVLVCTDSAARGVDVPGVTHVIQAEFAGNAVDYLHRIGRTARCGAEGRVTNLFGETNEELIRAVRDAESRGEPIEGAFSRKRSFRKKFKKYGPSRTAPQNRK